jgi:hypothetical protein
MPRPGSSSFVVAVVLLAAVPAAVVAQCPDPILSPAAPGHAGAAGPVLLDDFLSLVNFLYENPRPNGEWATRVVVIGGMAHQVPPWFTSSTECTEAKLQPQHGTASSFSNYLVSGDEFSELMTVTALADNPDRMLATHNTAQKMIAGSAPGGVPCVTAHVDVAQGKITCFDNGDSATDITARVALAYYHAANNPAFPCDWRAVYRASGDAIARKHLEVEYVHLPPGQCQVSAATGNSLCDWVAGGANTASSGLAGMEMWIGYHQDIVRMLLAAYQSTGDAVFLNRATDVVDQWLVASNFSGPAGSLGVGRMNYKWNTAVSPIAPMPGDGYFWQPGNPVWDPWDAPRAYWMADALRALLLTRTASANNLPLAYSILSNWVERFQASSTAIPGGSLPPEKTCLQPYHDGTCALNADDAYNWNGLGVGLYTFIGTSTVAPKLMHALSKFQWDTSHTWNDHYTCFGIYDGIRPLKALASAVGLDSPTYGGGFCGLRFFTVPPCRLLDTRTTSSPLSAGETRSLSFRGSCGIPESARALSLNVTVTQPSASGHLRFGADACAMPGTSTIDFAGGQTRANNGVLPLSRDAHLRLAAGAVLAGPGSVDLMIDVNGYFE